MCYTAETWNDNEKTQSCHTQAFMAYADNALLR